jgi:hypothetical protein
MNTPLPDNGRRRSGTGECAGIEGGGELTGVASLYNKPTKKVRVSMSVGKFHWKIPQKKK